MSDRPTAAPRGFPYPGHRTMAEADADERALGPVGARLMAERFRGGIVKRYVVPPTERLR